MPAGQLNVFLHGMWAIVSTSECLELLAPHDGGHAYDVMVSPAPPTAINALAPGSSYCLTGVTRRTAAVRFPREQALVVDNLGVVNRQAVHSSVYLPHPRLIEVRRKVKITADRFLSGSHGEKRATVQIPLVAVLTYDYANAGDLRLEDEALAAADASGPIDLDLYSEPPAANVPGLARRYACRAFDRLGRIFPGLDLKLIDVPYTSPCSYEECSLWERAQAGVAKGAALPAGLAQRPVLVSLVVENL